ncbi:unnamed protein product [Meganyctiphanes norvegica]|uniref:Uncharacterized protein n=1 Tax=Meganyctiphanes norvegica TaxID=48144 RepID=A0AAV2RRJ7_MEGNR
MSSGSSQKPGSTNTLQPQRQAKKKQGAAAGHQSATLQRHSAGTIDYDNLESYDNVPETHQQQQQHQRGGSVGKNSMSAVMSDGMDELSDSTTKSDNGMAVASTTGVDGGVDIIRSEGEEDEEDEEEEEVLSSQRCGAGSMSSVVVVKSGTLGRTPNHLSLSTTSTLSTGSTGSCARLIQASNQPAHYQPARSHAGSPVWKPRDSAFPSGGGGGSSSSGAGASSSQTLPRSHKIGVGREDHFLVYEEYGGNIYMSGGKKDQTGSSKTLNC